MLIQLTVCTVEDLASANESTLMRIGMGSRELKQKAQLWLDTAKNVGGATEKITALQVENAAIRDEMARLTKLMYANQAPNYAASAVPNNGLNIPSAFQAVNAPQTMPMPHTGDVIALKPVDEDPFA
jgi:hypothetical protein